MSVASRVMPDIREGSQLDLFITRFKRNKLAVLGFVISATYIGVSLIGPFLTPYDPGQAGVGPNMAPPSAEHWFGTDPFGRDIFSRVVRGGQVSLLVGFTVVFVACGIGIPAGLVAGYYRGILDRIIMRTVEVVYIFPSILLALIVIAILGTGLDRVILALGLAYAVPMARITRGSALSVREEEFVMAAISYGERDYNIIAREMLPNMVSSVLVQATLIYAFAILAEASMSYLGLSAEPPTPTWGIMVTQGQSVISIAPWVTLFPALATVVAVLGFTFMGVGLRDALDPQTDVQEGTDA